MPKATTPTSAREGRRHNPLERDILAINEVKQKAPKRKRQTEEEDGRSDGQVAREGQGPEFIPSAYLVDDGELVGL